MHTVNLGALGRDGMPRARAFNPTEIATIMSGHQASLTPRLILERNPTLNGRSVSGVYSLIEREKNRGLNVKLETRGKQRMMTRKQASALAKDSEENRGMPLAELQRRMGRRTRKTPPSQSTICRELREVGLNSYTKKKGPLTSPAIRAKCKEIFEPLIGKTPRYWRKRIFDDEKVFFMQLRNTRQTHRRRKEEKFLPDSRKASVKHSPKVSAWGCFSANGVGNIHLFDENMTGPKYTEILGRHLLPSHKELFPDSGGPIILYSDNDPKHMSKVAKAYKAEHNIICDLTAGHSPDLNPIENLWSVVEKKLHFKGRSMGAFKQAIRRAWKSITPNECKKLVDSMPNRMEVLKKAKWYPISY